MNSEPVLRRLAPLTSMYVRRATPEGRLLQPLERARTDYVRREGFVPCVLETIVTIDAKGRVHWANKRTAGWERMWRR